MKQKLFKKFSKNLHEEEIFVVIVLVIVALFNLASSPLLLDSKLANYLIQSSYSKKKTKPSFLSPVSRHWNDQSPYNFSKVKLKFSNHINYKKFKRLKKRDFEHWFYKKLPRKIQRKSKHYIPVILRLCEKYQVDPYLVVSLIWVESNFNHEAVSVKNAFGLMQLMPKTKNYLNQTIHQLFTHELPVSYFLHLIGGKLSAKDKIELVENLELGIYYLSRLQNRFRNTNYAIVAYNMGPSFILDHLSENKIPGSNNRYLNKIRNIYYQIDI